MLEQYQQSVKDLMHQDDQIKLTKIQTELAKHSLRDSEKQTELMRLHLDAARGDLNDSEKKRELMQLQLDAAKDSAKKNKWYWVLWTVVITTTVNFVISNFDKVIGWLQKLLGN